MPVNLLLCEGGAGSPDARVLSKLLAGRCRVLPLGAKYGMGDRITTAREVMRSPALFGLLDGDFAHEWATPRNVPREWTTSGGTVLGWRWERKEIENYLVDPEVAARALQAADCPVEDYAQALVEARASIACYQAARTALSISRVRFRDLPSGFGRKRGSEKHPFPDDLGEAACRDGVFSTVSAHSVTQTVCADDVVGRFDEIRPQCLPGGARYEHYLHTFAGKDLFWAMDTALQRIGFQGAMDFRERVLLAIGQATDDIGVWVPEWRALQQAVDAV